MGATIIYSGTVARQPAQGEMRRFIVRSRIDGRVTPLNPSSTDTQKAFLIPAGWLVEKVWARHIYIGAYSGSVQLIDSDAATWGATFGFGAQNVGATVGLGGGATALLSAQAAAGGKFFLAAGDMRATFTAATYFDGCIDVFASVIDMATYESPASWSD
jgi:hypothetical protein